MKALICIVVCCSLVSCDGSFQSFFKPNNSTTAVSVIKDDTDSTLPQPRAADVMPLFNLSDRTAQNGFIFRERSISNTSLNPTRQYYVKRGEFMDDENSRISELKAFKNKVIRYIDSLVETPKPKSNSLVYQTILSELDALVQTKAENKYMIIYSYMLQNSDEFSYYKKSDVLQAQLHPEQVVARFEKMGKLPDLTGVKVFVICNPGSYENEKKINLSIATFRALIEAKNGTLVLASNMNPEVSAK